MGKLIKSKGFGLVDLEKDETFSDLDNYAKAIGEDVSELGTAVQTAGKNITVSLGTNAGGDPIAKVEYQTIAGDTLSSSVAFDKEDFEVENGHIKSVWYHITAQLFGDIKDTQKWVIFAFEFLSKHPITTGEQFIEEVLRRKINLTSGYVIDDETETMKDVAYLEYRSGHDYPRADHATINGLTYTNLDEATFNPEEVRNLNCIKV